MTGKTPEKEWVEEFNDDERDLFRELVDLIPTEADLEMFSPEAVNRMLMRMYEEGRLKDPPELLPE